MADDEMKTPENGTEAAGERRSEPSPPTVRIPSMTADGARASVSLHIVHLELARSMPDGTYTPILHLALPASFAADLSGLLAHAVALRDELRVAAMSRALTEDNDGDDASPPDTTQSANPPPATPASTARDGTQRAEPILVTEGVQP